MYDELAGLAIEPLVVRLEFLQATRIGPRVLRRGLGGGLLGNRVALRLQLRRQFGDLSVGGGFRRHQVGRLRLQARDLIPEGGACIGAGRGRRRCGRHHGTLVAFRGPARDLRAKRGELDVRARKVARAQLRGHRVPAVGLGAVLRGE